ncbi:MAG: glutaminyl-peptide cyclotransferase [Opitutaceae bacterium]
MKNANLVSRLGWSMVTALALAFAGCGRNAGGQQVNVPASPVVAEAGGSTAPVNYSYEVINSWPHDRTAFTQGLVFRGDGFLESTGLQGRSSLRELDLKTGRVLKQVALPSEFFAEGLAVINGHAYQLTWQNRRAFVYDVDTFRRERELSYEGEGWGLATDGRVLILSDGSNRIRFLDPETFAVQRTIEVTAEGKPVDRLNELEWIKGEIFANVWQTDRVVRIDPATGKVRGVIDFSGLLPPADRAGTDVLNGIAYDAATDRLFVTGKKWPKIFEVRLKLRP